MLQGVLDALHLVGREAGQEAIVVVHDVVGPEEFPGLAIRAPEVDSVTAIRVFHVGIAVVPSRVGAVVALFLEHVPQSQKVTRLVSEGLHVIGLRDDV